MRERMRSEREKERESERERNKKETKDSVAQWKPRLPAQETKSTKRSFMHRERESCREKTERSLAASSSSTHIPHYISHPKQLPHAQIRTLNTNTNSAPHKLHLTASSAALTAASAPAILWPAPAPY